MPVLLFDQHPATVVRPGLERKLIHTGDLMTVVIDFTDGPWAQPEPPHSHPHVQTCYIAAGEILFFCEGEPEAHLRAGDMFCVPSGKLHNVQLLTPHARLVDSFSPIREDFLK
jgi:mannose-6-phosphate isomerase-like protein (cupin superfamily)